MSLANLTLDGMERYGAVELKRDANTFVTKGFVASVLMTASLFLIYFLLPAEQEEKVIQLIRRFAEIAPPPTFASKETPTVGFTAVSVPIKTSFGIPVPVPDIVAPQMTLPDLNAPTFVPGGPIRGTGSIISGPPVTIPVASKPEPAPVTDPDNPDVFVPADELPVMLDDLASVIIYPEIAKRSGLEGKVILSALIDEDGKVILTHVEQADYEVFRQAAIDAVLKVRFRPGLLDKEPVRLWVTVPISFKLTTK